MGRQRVVLVSSSPPPHPQQSPRARTVETSNDRADGEPSSSHLPWPCVPAVGRRSVRSLVVTRPRGAGTPLARTRKPSSRSECRATGVPPPTALNPDRSRATVVISHVPSGASRCRAACVCERRPANRLTGGTRCGTGPLCRPVTPTQSPPGCTRPLCRPVTPTWFRSVASAAVGDGVARAASLSRCPVSSQKRFRVTRRLSEMPLPGSKRRGRPEAKQSLCPRPRVRGHCRLKCR